MSAALDGAGPCQSPAPGAVRLASAAEAGMRLLLHRRELRRVRATPDPDAPAARSLADGEVRLRVAHVALTPAAVACARAGERLGCWRFFPGEDTQWGCLPMWGHATVVESRHPALACGRRVFGLLPMGTHLVVAPVVCGAGGFADGAAHRAALPLVYSLFSFAADDDSEDRQALQALSRPLFSRRTALPSGGTRLRWARGSAAAEEAVLSLLAPGGGVTEGVMLRLAS